MSELFIKKGDEYLMTAGGVVLIAADAIYGPPHETTPQGRENAKRMMDAILGVAAERGFKRRDLLETMLARREMSPRVRDLAQQVDKCLGKEGFRIALERAGGGL
ncbi:hypothetical protein [Robbsia andropogonis]|uniref:hypothetical protein n=1 Tax=Robbsia andropogonis TaxID=28092 RepID=UPI000465900C|nr:hypothetical protein [Robbsia andropogonis]